MVATGLPITTQAPPATAQTAAEVPDAATAADGGFLGTLMQLLTPQDPADAVAAGGAGVVAQLLDDAVGDVPDDLPVPEGVPAMIAPIVFPSVQPAEIRAAQQMAREAGDGAAALSALTDAAVTGAAAGSADSDLAVLERLASATGLVLQGLSTDPSAIGLQTAAISQPAVAETGTAIRSTQTEAPVARQIHTPVGAPGWSDELGAQLHLMADKGHSVASLRLSPEHLGPLEVQISVEDNKASVWFGATNGETRTALEQALPRLREMFAAQGMSLSQSGVFNQSQREPGRQTAGSTMQGAQTEGITGVDSGVQIALKRGLVDAYA